jgi:hypothetical protein
MNKHTARAVVALSVALAAAAALASRREGPRPAAASAAGAATVGPGAAGTGAAHRPGRQRRWALEVEAAVDRGAGGEPLVTRVVGDWLATVVAAARGSYDVAYEIAGARASGGGVSGVRAADVAELERRLGRRFYVTYRDDGAAVRAHFPRDLEPGTRNLLQLVATETMLVRPPVPEAQWIASERDGAGMYLAAYHETAPGHVVKTKLRYVHTDGATEVRAPDGLAVRVDASEQRIDLDAGGEIVAFSGREATHVDLGGGGGPDGGRASLGMRIAVRLSAPRDAEAPELAGALERERAGLVTTGIVTHAPPPAEALAERDRRLVEGTTLAGLLAAAAEAAPSGAAPSGAGPGAGDRLAAWLRLREGDAAEVAALVRRRGGAKIATDALGVAGTAAAQRALVALARDRALPGAARVDALSGLIAVAAPLAETMGAARDLWDDADAAVARAALFASGSLARAGRQEHPAAARALDRGLGALLARPPAAGLPDRRSDVLAALGNSASPEALPAVEAALADGDAAVRAAAARALRLQASPAVDGLLGRAMVGDRDATVRAAAIVAAGFRTIGPLVEPLTRAALADPVEYVRTNALDLLAQNAAASPTVVATLAAAAEHDPAPGVRRLARTALGKR